MKNEKENISFNSILKESRISKDLDIESIADTLKINVKYLKAIEDCDLDIVPNTYIRLFIKSYAQFLKLDSKKILEQFESETNLKRKSIFKNLTKNTSQTIKETRKISVKNDSASDKKEIKTNLSFNEEIIENKKSSSFNINEKYFLKPKNILSSFLLATLLLCIYLLVSFLSNQQNTSSNEQSNDENMDLSNNHQIIDNSLLTNDNFNQNKFHSRENYKLRYINDLPYKLQIVTKEKTKLNVSFDKKGKRIEEFNNIASSGTLIQLNQNDNIYFDLWNAKHVEISIGNKSITKYLKNDFIVRGSFKPTDKILYLEFYKY